jgi:hypothetical protein
MNANATATSNMELINKLQYFSLDEQVIEKSLKMKMESQRKPFVAKEPFKIVKPISKIYIPSEKDTLFWCFFIMKHGDTHYEMLDNKNIIVEKRNKIEYVEKIRKDKQLIKTYKFTTLTNLENNLANEDKVNIGTFLSLCAFENLNVLYIKNKTYYELLMNDEPTVFIVYQVQNNKYGIEQSVIANTTNIKNTLYKIDNVDKPIKPFSAYKLQDLIDIAIKLGFEITNTTSNKAKNKKELYEDIVKCF